MLQFIIVDEIGKTESNKHRSDDKTQRVRCYLGNFGRIFG